MAIDLHGVSESIVNIDEFDAFENDLDADRIAGDGFFTRNALSLVAPWAYEVLVTHNEFYLETPPSKVAAAVMEGIVLSDQSAL